eukprot:755710-Hanusia_phi.AAC.5
MEGGVIKGGTPMEVTGVKCRRAGGCKGIAEGSFKPAACCRAEVGVGWELKQKGGEPRRGRGGIAGGKGGIHVGNILMRDKEKVRTQMEVGEWGSGVSQWPRHCSGWQ